MTGAHDSMLVSVTGTLELMTKDDDAAVLNLRDGTTTFTASVSNAMANARLADLHPRAILKLTGVCRAERKEQSRSPRAFAILTRDGADVTVLRDAPLLTAHLAREAAGLVGVAALLGTIWLILLRRKVRKQTEFIHRRVHLEAAMEERYRDLFQNASDPVFSLDFSYRFITINTAGEAALGYSAVEPFSDIAARLAFRRCGGGSARPVRPSGRRRVDGPTSSDYSISVWPGHRPRTELPGALLSRRAVRNRRDRPRHHGT
jgi:PAS domain-containing protein